MLQKIGLAAFIGYATAVGIHNLQFSDETTTSFSVSWETSGDWDEGYSVAVFKDNMYDQEHFVAGVNITDGSTTASFSGLEESSFYGVQVSTYNFTGSVAGVDSATSSGRTDGEGTFFWSTWDYGLTGYIMWGLGKSGGYSFSFTFPCETDHFGLGADTVNQVTVGTVDNTTFDIYVSDKALQSHSWFSFWATGCDMTEFTSDDFDTIEFDGFSDQVISLNTSYVGKWTSDGAEVTQLQYALPATATQYAIPSFTLIVPCVAVFTEGWSTTDPVQVPDKETTWEFDLSDTWQNGFGFTFTSDGCGDPELIMSYKVIA